MMKKIKSIFVVLMLTVFCVFFTGCRKPYDKPEFVTIEASQTAFLIPLVGDTGNQASFESEELLLQAKVATKEIQIPHRWVQTGRRHWMGEYRPSAILIVVERKPVSRSWESGTTTDTSNNRAIFGETSDGIGIYVGMNCSAQIEESDAAKFLYRYNNTSLETIIDTDIKKMVEDEFNMETSKYTSTDLLNHKAEIMTVVKNNVINYFKQYGITITVLGLKEGISYENPEIQEAIDAKFASEQELVIQQNKNEANIAKAEAEAEVKRIAADAEAYKVETEKTAVTDMIDKLYEKYNSSLTYDECAQIVLQTIFYEKWNGQLPEVLTSDNLSSLIGSLISKGE